MYHVWHQVHLLMQLRSTGSILLKDPGANAKSIYPAGARQGGDSIKSPSVVLTDSEADGLVLLCPDRTSPYAIPPPSPNSGLALLDDERPTQIVTSGSVSLWRSNQRRTKNVIHKMIKIPEQYEPKSVSQLIPKFFAGRKS